MKVTETPLIKYYPRWNGNRQLPEKEKFWVDVKMMSKSELAKCQKESTAANNAKESEAQSFMDKLIKRFVVKVNNLEIKKKTIGTPDELLNVEFNSLILDIASGVAECQMLSGEEEKN